MSFDTLNCAFILAANMNGEHCQKLIQGAGSPRAFAIRLGIHGEPNWSQRVDNWRTRGIPIEVQLHKGRQLRGLERTAKRKGLL